MDHLYHVQYEVKAYYQHIPKVPDTILINKELLFGLSNSQFLEQFKSFTDIMSRMYRDMERRPDAYGLPLIDINQVNENKADGNLAKASWRSIKKLGDMVAAIGKHGELRDDTLIIPIPAFKTALAKMNKSNLILNRLVDFGFILSHYDGQKFVKGADAFSISHSNNPLFMKIMKAYALSEPYHPEDPHEFYYFDYKRVADRKALPPHCVASDLAALLGGDTGNAFFAIHKALVEELGLSQQYKDDNLEYFLKGKRVARLMIDFHTLNLEMILKLKDMDRYRDQIEKLPKNLRAAFEYGNCKYCGFQGSTQEYCKFRISWTLDGRKHDTCNFFSFGFRNLRSEDVLYYLNLMRCEYIIA